MTTAISIHLPYQAKLRYVEAITNSCKLTFDQQNNDKSAIARISLSLILAASFDAVLVGLLGSSVILGCGEDSWIAVVKAEGLWVVVISGRIGIH